MISLNGSRTILRLLLLCRNFHASPRTLSDQINTIALNKTRNIGIIAHIDAGKTTTTERMLFYSGKTARIGNVDDGDTITDYLPSERERGITIQLAAISFMWNKHKINLIDTPGHADFTFEVVRSLRVLDGAVTILDAVAGVEAQTEKVWGQAAALQIPRLAYVNKMDRVGAGFSRTVREIVTKLQTKVVCLNVPYFIDGPDGERTFAGVLDVIDKKLLLWDSELDSSGRAVNVLEASDLNVLEILKKARASMVETLGEIDEAVIELFFENDEDYMSVPENVLINAIQKGTISNELTPVLCGSSFKNVGVQPLLDAAIRYLPSPLAAQLPVLKSSLTKRSGKKKRASQTSAVDVPLQMDPRTGLKINNNPNLTVALAFKVITHPARGVMAFFRVYSGKLASNSVVVNTRTGKKLHIRKLTVMHGDTPEEVLYIMAGNIGLVTGTGDDVITGDTLVSHGATSSKSFTELESKLTLNPIEIPPPLFNSAIEPATAGDTRHMNDCILVLLREDPSLHMHTDDELGQTIISGMGELHLEIMRNRLVDDMKAKVRLRDVAVSYKETLAKPSGDVVQCTSLENDAVWAKISLDSFEGRSDESSFADEEGSELLEEDNNIIIFGPSATPTTLKQAVDERRWKLESSLEDLQDELFQGCATGLQIGGNKYGLPLNSCVVRIHEWLFPLEDKLASPSLLLEVGRRAVTTALKQIADTNPDAVSVMEPIMSTKVFVDSSVMGDVVHDLNSRCQATILAIDDGSENLEKHAWAHEEAAKLYLPPDYTDKYADTTIASKKTIVAETPLREMVGYLSRLRTLTQGKGVFDMSYVGMRRVTPARLSSIKSELTFM